MKSFIGNFLLVVLIVLSAIFFCPLNYAYAEGGFISGKVAKSDGKTPIAGVRIAATQVVKEGEDYELGFAETNNKGEYVIENLTAGIYEVIASFPGFADAEKTNVSVASSKVTSDINFMLIEYGTISGRVTENDGITPISNVEIGAYGVSAGLGFCTSELSGSFKVEEVLPGTYTIEADVEGYTFSPVETVRLEEGEDLKGVVIKAHKKHFGKISGTVTESDGVTPIGEAIISAIPQDLKVDDSLGQKTISKGDGTYTIEGLQGGTYVLQAVKSGFGLDIRTLAVPEDTHITVNISLSATYASISGYVLKEDGITPVVGATIYCMNIEFPTAPIEIKTVTDAQGKFILDGLIPGSYSVQAKIEGYPIQFKSDIDVVAGETTQGINFILAISTGAISGMILDKNSGQAVPNGFVFGGPSGGGSGTSAYKMTHDGSFLIEKLQPGTYEAMAGALNYSTSTEKNIVVIEGETTEITIYIERE